MAKSDHDPYNLHRKPVEFWNVSDIKPYDRNNKKHSKEHIESLKRSISDPNGPGLMDPLIVEEDGTIIAGHGRYEAILLIGTMKTVPVRVATGLSKSQAAAARIAHNRLASQDYDTEVLNEEIARLSEEADVDLMSLGLTDREIEVAIGDFGDMDLSALSEDLAADIDEQEKEVRAKSEEVGRKEVFAKNVMGFNKIYVDDEYLFRKLRAKIKEDTGHDAYEGFVEWIKGIVE